MTERMASNDEVRRPKRDPEPPPGPERRKPWVKVELAAVLPGLVIAGLGIIFLLGQIVVWQQLAGAGIHLRTNPSSAFIYILTGAHAVHLLGGV